MRCPTNLPTDVIFYDYSVALPLALHKWELIQLFYFRIALFPEIVCLCARFVVVNVISFGIFWQHTFGWKALDKDKPLQY